MRREVEQGRADSVRRFRDLIVPALGEVGIKGKWQTVEDDIHCVECGSAIRNPVSAILDASTGIDALYRNDTSVLGIGLRVQPVIESFDTFTVRGHKRNGASTEIDRYRDALKRGTLHPHLLLHAYISPDEKHVIAFGLAYLQAVVKMIDSGKCTDIPNTYDGTIFHAVKWRDIADEGYWIRAYHRLRPGLWLDIVEQVA